MDAHWQALAWGAGLSILYASWAVSVWLEGREYRRGQQRIDG